MEVGQFLYTRLEKVESPYGRGGFQTLCYTRSLIHETLMAEIESYLQCDPVSEEPQLLFYPVGQEQVVLVQLQTIPDVDACGRGGNFVAHGFVLSYEQFLSVGGNPITLAESLRFIAGGAEARRQGDRSTGDIQAYRISTDSLAISLANSSAIAEKSRWHGVALRNLLLLAVSLCNSDMPRRTVALHGPTDRILATLQLIFELIPGKLRPSLSFGTHCRRVERRGALLQGFRTSPMHAGCDEINATDCVVDGLEDTETSFGRWVRQTIMAVTAADFIRLNEYCWWLGRLIDDGELDDIQFSPCDTVAEEFWRINQDASRRRMLAVVKRRIGHTLAQRATKWLLDHYHPTELFAQIAAGGNDTALAHALHLAYCDAAEPLEREETSQLVGFLQRFHDARLNVWLAIWTSDWPLLETHLQALHDDDLSRFINDISETPHVDIARLVLSGREPAVVAGLLGERGSSAPVGGSPMIIEAAAAIHQVKSFSNARLANLLRVMSVKANLLARDFEQAVVSECERRGVRQPKQPERVRRWSLR